MSADKHDRYNWVVAAVMDVTREMEDAGMDAARKWFGPEIARSGITRTSAREFFKAMLAVAPKPHVGDVNVDVALQDIIEARLVMAIEARRDFNITRAIVREIAEGLAFDLLMINAIDKTTDEALRREVVAIAAEREAGFSARRHADTVNAEAADKAVALARRLYAKGEL